MTNQISTQTIQFHNHALITFEQNGAQYTAMRPICENIGLEWSSQSQRIKRDEVLNSVVFMINTTGNDGKTYQMLCLPLEYLNGWLFGIDVKRVKPEIRDTLITYKKECYKALHDYWVNGKAKRSVNTAKLTKPHQETIKDLVLGRVKNLPKEQQAGIIIKQWSALKTHFGKSYKDIDDDQFPEAISLLARLPLEGELIIDEPKADTERVLNLNSEGVNAVINCFYTATRMQEAVGCLLTNLRTFRSNTLDSVRFNFEAMDKYIRETQPHVEQLVKQRYKPQTPHIRNQKRLTA